MIPISLNRNICRSLDETTTREWLITNGTGAYASGTVAGMLTRMEHGLLVAPTLETSTPQLLLAKIDEEVVFDTRTYYLGTNEYRDGTLNPSGFVHLETFHLDEGFPVFTYRLGGIDGMMLEKRIWMPTGHNTTYIQYRLLRTTTEEASGRRRSGITGALSNITSASTDAPQSLALTLLPLTAYRPYNEAQHGSHSWQFQVRQLRQQGHMAFSEQEDEEYTTVLPVGVAGCTIRAWDGASSYSLLAVGQEENDVTFLPTNLWYWNFKRRHDAAYGRAELDDLYLPGVFRAILHPGEDASLTIIASTEEVATQTLVPEQLHRSYQRSVEGQRQFVVGSLQAQRYFGDGGEAAHVYPGHSSYAPYTTPYTATSSGLSSSRSTHSAGDETYQRYLVQAVGRFLAQWKLPQTDSVLGEHRVLFGQPDRAFVIRSDYYQLHRNTRDILIAFPGLLCTRNHTRELARMLREIARHFKQGLLPDTLPLPGQVVAEDEYRSIDLPLWYCYALDSYLRIHQDDALLEEVYQQVAENIRWYIRGTLHGIHVDDDGLLTSTDALTWMNAYDGERPITPRTGKPVEVNALWYHTLSLLNEWSQYLYRTGRINYHNAPTISYRDLLTRCYESFNRRFWHPVENEEHEEEPEAQERQQDKEHNQGYLFDVVDGLEGDDEAIRPNQLFAFSLRYPVLAEEKRAAVLDVVTRYLLTPYGLRTLAPQHEHYRGHLGLRPEEQSQALHQGGVWTWLLGPYLNAVLSADHMSYILPLSGKQTQLLDSDGEPKQAHDRYHEYLLRRGLQLLNMQQETLQKGLLGVCGSLFDGDAPHTPGDMAASLLSTAELLRAYDMLQSRLVTSTTRSQMIAR